MSRRGSRTSTRNETIIKDIDIKGKSVNDIINLKNDNDNVFKLTNEAITDAYIENDMKKMRYLRDEFDLTFPEVDQCLDIAAKEGNEELAKFLVYTFSAKASATALREGIANGHKKLVLWLELFALNRHPFSLSQEQRKSDSSIRHFGRDDVIIQQTTQCSVKSK